MYKVRIYVDIYIRYLHFTDTYFIKLAFGIIVNYTDIINIIVCLSFYIICLLFLNLLSRK